MSRARPLIVALLLGATLGVAACASPPESEMQQAQGAIDAARSAGAERYARDELAAAQEALTKAREAADLRDFRLALSYALDSRERAQNAAKQAADGTAAARVEGDRALTALVDSLAAARASLGAAEKARVPARSLDSPRRTVVNAEQQVQEARAALQRGDYEMITAMASKTVPSLRAISDQLRAAVAQPARQRP